MLTKRVLGPGKVVPTQRSCPRINNTLLLSLLADSCPEADWPQEGPLSVLSCPGHISSPSLLAATLLHLCQEDGPSASEADACRVQRLLPARWQQQGVGVQSQRKPLFIKLPAPSSTLEAGAWALDPTLVWGPSGPAPTRQSEATGSKPPHTPGSAGTARSGARAPQ